MIWASLVAQTLQHQSAMQKTQVWSLGQEDPLEKEMASHFSVLAWRIPWTEEPGGLQSLESQRVRHNWAKNTHKILYVCVCARTYMHAKSLQSCPTLCDPRDYSPSGSSVHGVLQARILEWVAMLSSRESSWPRDQTHDFYISCIGKQVLYY